MNEKGGGRLEDVQIDAEYVTGGTVDSMDGVAVSARTYCRKVVGPRFGNATEDSVEGGILLGVGEGREGSENLRQSCLFATGECRMCTRRA